MRHGMSPIREELSKLEGIGRSCPVPDCLFPSWHREKQVLSGGALSTQQCETGSRCYSHLLVIFAATTSIWSHPTAATVGSDRWLSLLPRLFDGHYGLSNSLFMFETGLRVFLHLLLCPSLAAVQVTGETPKNWTSFSTHAVPITFHRKDILLAHASDENNWGSQRIQNFRWLQTLNSRTGTCQSFHATSLCGHASDHDVNQCMTLQVANSLPSLEVEVDTSLFQTCSQSIRSWLSQEWWSGEVASY